MATNEQRQRIVDYYEDPYHHGRCDGPTHVGEANHEACGDVVAIEIRVSDGRLSEIWFEGEGCEVSQGAASIFAEHLEGQLLDDVLSTTIESAKEIVHDEDQSECCSLGFKAILAALNSPLSEEEIEERTFSGPDLGDEC